jgi:hypothetical protein
VRGIVAITSFPCRKDFFFMLCNWFICGNGSSQMGIWKKTGGYMREVIGRVLLTLLVQI